MGKHYQKNGTVAGTRSNADRKRFRKVTALALAVCAVGTASIGSFATVLAEDATVTSKVIDGTKLYSVSIPSTDVDALLREAGITLNDQDMVVQEENANGTTVTVKRQITADINVDDKTVTTHGYTGDTVGQLIENAGITLKDTDAVSPSASTQVWEDNTDVDVTEMKSVYVVDKNVARNYLVPAGTVAEAIASTDIQLGKNDYVSDSKKAVTDGMVIAVNRVTYEKVEKTESVDFEVKEKETDTLYQGETEVQTEGQAGEKVVTYQQKLVNGEVVKTKKLDEKVTKEAQDKIVLVGTKVKETAEEQKPQQATETTNSATNSTTTRPQTNSGNTFMDASGNTVSYRTMLSGTCTAYSGGGITATGVPAAVGVVAVNPNQIPYGTRLYITSPDGSYVYGYAVAGDTGGAMMAGQAMCDLYMNTEQECYNFGRRTMNIYILD